MSPEEAKKLSKGTLLILKKGACIEWSGLGDDIDLQEDCIVVLESYEEDCSGSFAWLTVSGNLVDLIKGTSEKDRMYGSKYMEMWESDGAIYATLQVGCADVELLQEEDQVGDHSESSEPQ